MDALSALHCSANIDYLKKVDRVLNFYADVAERLKLRDVVFEEFTEVECLKIPPIYS